MCVTTSACVCVCEHVSRCDFLEILQMHPFTDRIWILDSHNANRERRVASLVRTSLSSFTLSWPSWKRLKACKVYRHPNNPQTGVLLPTTLNVRVCTTSRTKTVFTFTDDCITCSGLNVRAHQSIVSANSPNPSEQAKGPSLSQASPARRLRGAVVGSASLCGAE